MDLKELLTKAIEKEELDKEEALKEEQRQADKKRLEGNASDDDKKDETGNNDTSALLSLIEKQNKAIEALSTRLEALSTKKDDEGKKDDKKKDEETKTGQLTRDDLSAMLDDRDRRNIVSTMSEKEKSYIEAFGFDPATMPLENLIKFRANFAEAEKEVRFKLGKDENKAGGNNGRPLSTRAHLDKYYKWKGTK